MNKNMNLLKKFFHTMTTFLCVAAFFIGSITTATVCTYAEDANAAWPAAPEIASPSAILIDADTGAILYEKDAYSKRYPASTTKILTGLLTIENCSLDETVTFSREAAESVTIEDASLGTRTGEQYSVEQALYGLLLHSANEIAYGLAEHVAGSLPAFVELMNKRASELGAKNTHFSNASGLHSNDHYTTAYDLAMIARGCYNNPTFVNIDSTYTTYSIPPTNKYDNTRYFQHRHLMLQNRAYYYEYCKGGKTGFTDEAGYTLVTFAENNGMRLIAVVLQSTPNQRFIDTRTLFDWGFDNFEKTTATGNTTASMFSNDTYYNSAVFNRYNISFNLNAAILTLPDDASAANVSIKADSSESAVILDGMLKTKINYLYNDNIVGTNTLTLSSASASADNGVLPYITNNSSKTPSAKKCLVINVWFVLIIVLIIMIGIYLKVLLTRSRQAKKRRSRRTKNLHF